ncbi:hypothetical protein AB9E13_34335, partial [Rhizobium leguminosarum]
RTNVALYPAFQAYLREHRPPTLILWGKNDPIFLPDGARAYLRDVGPIVVDDVQLDFDAARTVEEELVVQPRRGVDPRLVL